MGVLLFCTSFSLSSVVRAVTSTIDSNDQRSTKISTASAATMAATLLPPARLPSDEGALTLKTAVLIAAVAVAVSLEGLRKLGIVTGVSSCTPWSCTSSAAAGRGGGGEEGKEEREAQDQNESDHVGNARRNPSAKAATSVLQRQQLLHDTAARVNAMGHRLRDGIVVKLVGNRSAVAVSSPCAAGSALDHAACEACCAANPCEDPTPPDTSSRAPPCEMNDYPEEIASFHRREGELLGTEASTHVPSSKCYSTTTTKSTAVEVDSDASTGDGVRVSRSTSGRTSPSCSDDEREDRAFPAKNPDSTAATQAASGSASSRSFPSVREKTLFLVKRPSGEHFYFGTQHQQQCWTFPLPSDTILVPGEEEESNRTLAIAGERVAFATVRDRAEFLLTMKVLNQQGMRQVQRGCAAAAHVQRGCASASKASWAEEAA